MANWTNIDVNSLLPGQPFTSAIALAYEENPRAIAAQATGAPKVADKTAWASGSTVTFSGLDDYAGIFIKGGGNGTTDNTQGTVTFNISFSDDGGSSFSGTIDFSNAVIGGASEDWIAQFELFLDFATGQVRSAGIAVGGTSGVGVPIGVNTNFTTASLDITDVRITVIGSTMRAMAIPQGGESAS